MFFRTQALENLINSCNHSVSSLAKQLPFHRLRPQIQIFMINFDVSKPRGKKAKRQIDMLSLNNP